MIRNQKDTCVLLKPLTFNQAIVELGKAHKSRLGGRRNLEDYEPGCTREEALKVLEKVATSPKPSRKHGK